MLSRIPQPDCDDLDTVKRRAFGMTIREALRLVLRALEEYYDLPRSFETQQERRERRG
jgi:hypothetical protein